jgi:hypothetical protein
MTPLLLDRFAYRVRGVRVLAVCRVEAIRLADERSLVIATEVPDNTGTSVTNACEELATQVCQRLALDPRHVVWVEHYGYPSRCDPERVRTYYLVTFASIHPRRSPIFEGPNWRPMTEMDWRSLGLVPREPLDLSREAGKGADT